MLDLLAERERPVMELVEAFHISQPSISEHLRVLRDAGLVERTKLGRQRIYRLRPMPMKELADWVAAFQCFWTQRLDALGEYLDRTPQPTAPHAQSRGISMEID